MVYKSKRSKKMHTLFGLIGSYARRVDDRNASVYSNGNIFYSEPSALERKISEILRVPIADIATAAVLALAHRTDFRGAGYSIWSRWGAGRPAHKAAEKSNCNLDIRKMAWSGCLPDGWFKGQ